MEDADAGLSNVEMLKTLKENLKDKDTVNNIKYVRKTAKESLLITTKTRQCRECEN